MTAFDGDATKGRLHASVGYAENAFGEVFEGRERFGGNRRECAAGAGLIETHGVAQEVIGVKTAEDKVRIGDGGAIAAAIARGTGNGACGLRADLQCAGMVHPCKRAAACAGGMNVEHGHADGETGDLSFGAGGRFACGVEECDVGGRSAHVESEDAIDTEARATLSAPITPPAGPERIVRTGSRTVDAAERIPPEDCMMLRLVLRFARPRWSAWT